MPISDNLFSAILSMTGLSRLTRFFLLATRAFRPRSGESSVCSLPFLRAP